MKKKLLFLTFIGSFFSYSQTVGLGIGTTSPNSSAIVDVSSNSKGVLPPRMTYVQRNAIASPVAGLMVWCLDCATNGELQIYNGTAWTNLAGAASNFAKPSAPTITKVKGGNTQTIVHFNAPASDGGSIITGYTATASPGGLSATIYQATAAPITITGLTNGTTYTYTVTATNAVGSTTSGASEPLANCGANTTTLNEFLVFGCYNLGAPDTGNPFAYQNGAINGDLYQWGRKTDGHEKRTSEAVSTTPANNTSPPLLNNLDLDLTGKFILTGGDWTSATMTGLWSDTGTKGPNDPCPTGFKVPSRAQWGSIFNGTTTSNYTQYATANIWDSTGSGFMVGNSLYLPKAGFRDWQGNVNNQWGSYWTTTASGINYGLQFGDNYINFHTGYPRTNGYSVRCVQDNNY